MSVQKKIYHTFASSKRSLVPSNFLLYTMIYCYKIKKNIYLLHTIYKPTPENPSDASEVLNVCFHESVS